MRVYRVLGGEQGIDASRDAGDAFDVAAAEVRLRLFGVLRHEVPEPGEPEHAKEQNDEEDPATGSTMHGELAALRRRFDQTALTLQADMARKMMTRKIVAWNSVFSSPRRVRMVEDAEPNSPPPPSLT